MYLEPQYQEAYTRWRAQPNPATMAVMLQQVRPILDLAMRQYGASGPTLQARARLMAAQALRSYDPSRGSLRNHLMMHLQGLRRQAARQSQIVRLPERVALDMGYLRRGRLELVDLLGREPSTAELADHVGFSPAKIQKLQRVRPGLAEGQTIRETDEGEDEAAPAVVHPQYRDAWIKYVYHDLPGEDQLLLEHTTGFGGAPILSKTQIASKLGLSPGAVSQRLKKLQGKLEMPVQARELFGGG